jgi:Rho-type GTPase-activating protein 1/2
MTARNLGVVFGREYSMLLKTEHVVTFLPTATLMRSPNPNAEFSDMAGKALSVEWLVENAPQVFIRETLN